MSSFGRPTIVLAFSLLAAAACSPSPTETRPDVAAPGPSAIILSPMVAGGTGARGDSLRAFLSELPARDAANFATAIAGLTEPFDITASGNSELAARFNRIWRQRDGSTPEVPASSSFGVASVTVVVDARADRNEVIAYRRNHESVVVIRATDFSENAVSSGLVALARLKVLASRHARGDRVVKPFSVEPNEGMPDSWRRYVGQLTASIAQSRIKRVTIAAVGKLP